MAKEWINLPAMTFEYDNASKSKAGTIGMNQESVAKELQSAYETVIAEIGPRALTTDMVIRLFFQGHPEVVVYLASLGVDKLKADRQEEEHRAAQSFAKFFERLMADLGPLELPESCSECPAESRCDIKVDPEDPQCLKPGAFDDEEGPDA